MKWKLLSSPKYYDWYIKKLAGWIEAYRENELLQVVDSCIADNAVVLDIGCGTGTTLILLGQQYPEAKIVGIDINPDYLSYAKQKLDDLGIENVKLIKQDVTKITKDNIGKDSIDIAICVLGLSVFPEWEQAIDQIYSILNSGGYFIVFDLYIDTQNVVGRFSNFLAKLFFRAHHDRMILNNLSATFTEIDTIKIDVKPESKTTLFIFKGKKEEQ